MLSDSEHSNVITYLDDLLELFRLTEWTLVLETETTEEYEDRTRDQDEEPAEPAIRGQSAPLARIVFMDGRLCAVLRLSESWEKVSTKVRRDTLVHEVLHIVHNDLSNVAFQGIVMNGKSGKNALFSLFDDHAEKMVDRLAGCIAPRLSSYPPKKIRSGVRVHKVGEWI